MTIATIANREAAPARVLPWRAGLAAAGTSVMFGFVPLAARGLYADGLSTWSMLCWRYLLALVIIFSGIRLAGLHLGAAIRQGAWRIALVGVTLGAAQTLCYFQSLRHLDTGIAVLLFYTFPVVTLAIERCFFKQPVAPAALFCVLVILAGAAMIAGPGLHNGTIDPRGLAWAVPGPVIYAFYLAANARLMARHPPLIGAGFLYGGLATAYLGAALWLGASLPKSAPGWLSLAFLAIGPGAVAAISQSYSMPRLGPATYAIIANCELVTVVVVGIVVLDERFTASRGLGGGLIITGILLYGWVRKPPRSRVGKRPRIAAPRAAGAAGDGEPRLAP
jgi:drug/metabolite transporter (DMT)-like permease